MTMRQEESGEFEMGTFFVGWPKYFVSVVCLAILLSCAVYGKDVPVSCVAGSNPACV